MTVENYLAETAALAGLAGIMAGWMRSRITGILTTVFAVISTCLILQRKVGNEKTK